MKILVSGGAGFIGSHIVDAYIALGNTVVVVDNFATGQKQNVNPKALFYHADIRDKKAIGDIFAKEQPQILNHHAAQLDVRKSVADPAFDADVNIMGLLNVLENGIRNGLSKVIFASSGGVVYGDASVVPTPEDYQPLKPISPYGIAKLTSEYYLQFFESIKKIKTVSFRYANIYGPRQNPHGEAGVIAIFIKKMLEGETPVIYGDGTQVRDYTYVGDVVKANTQALSDTVSGIFNIGTGVGTSVNDIFSKLQKSMGSSTKATHGPAKEGEQKRSILQYAKAATELNWNPTVNLDTGLAQTVTFFETNAKK